MTYRERLLRGYRSLAKQAVPPVTGRAAGVYDVEAKYEDAVEYFALALLTLQYLSAVTTRLVPDRQPMYDSTLDRGFDVNAFSLHDIARGVSEPARHVIDGIPAVADETFWSQYVQSVLQASTAKFQGTLALYVAALRLQTCALQPMSLCLAKGLFDGRDGVLEKVLRAQLYGMAGQPEHGTVGDYRHSESAASARPPLHAARSADIEAAAQVTDVPLATIQHLHLYAGPFLLLHDSALVKLQTVLQNIQDSCGDVVQRRIAAAADVAGTQAIHDPDLVRVDLLQYLPDLLALSRALDDMRLHQDREYLEEEIGQHVDSGLST